MKRSFCSRRWVVAVLIVVTSLFLLCGCIEEPAGQDAVSGTGIVIYQDIEGGFYGIMADDGTRYLPLNLGDEYQIDGLSVRFSGTPREDLLTIAQWGTPIELTSIQKSGDGHVTMEESRRIAEDYVKGTDEFRQYGGTNLRLTGTETLQCPYCWQFTFGYDMISMKDPDVIDHVVEAVTIADGEMREVTQSAGLPTGIMTVGELAADQVYETPVTLIGRVSLLGQLNCPCFHLTSGGESVEVYYDLMVEDDRTELPAVSVEGIENGDIVLVEGKLKESGTYRNKGAFWAENITTYP
jgi:hypothetical protein